MKFNLEKMFDAYDKHFLEEYVAEVQRENSEQFNYYTECVSDENKRIQN